MRVDGRRGRRPASARPRTLTGGRATTRPPRSRRGRRAAGSRTRGRAGRGRRRRRREPGGAERRRGPRPRPGAGRLAAFERIGRRAAGEVDGDERLVGGAPVVAGPGSSARGPPPTNQDRSDGPGRQQQDGGRAGLAAASSASRGRDARRSARPGRGPALGRRDARPAAR